MNYINVFNTVSTVVETGLSVAEYPAYLREIPSVYRESVLKGRLYTAATQAIAGIACEAIALVAAAYGARKGQSVAWTKGLAFAGLALLGRGGVNVVRGLGACFGAGPFDKNVSRLGKLVHFAFACHDALRFKAFAPSLVNRVKALAS